MAMAISSLNFRAAATASTSTSSSSSISSVHNPLPKRGARLCCIKHQGSEGDLWSCSRREAIFVGAACTYGAAFPGAASLAEEESNMTVLSSGLGFYDARVGDGKPVVSGSFVKVNYTGKFEDGTEFESSYRFPQKPLSFRLGVKEVIDGWDLGILGGEGIPPMRTGGRRLLQVPPSMAFGDEGVGCKKGKPLLTLIGSLLHPGKEPDKASQAPNCFVSPNATLFFDVELLEAFELPKDPSEARRRR